MEFGFVPFLVEEIGVAPILGQLRLSSLKPVKRHADLPRPREDFGVLDGGFIEHVVWSRWCIPFHDVQLLTVEVPSRDRTRSCR